MLNYLPEALYYLTHSALVCENDRFSSTSGWHLSLSLCVSQTDTHWRLLSYVLWAWTSSYVLAKVSESHSTDLGAGVLSYIFSIFLRKSIIGSDHIIYLFLNFSIFLCVFFPSVFRVVPSILEPVLDPVVCTSHTPISVSPLSPLPTGNLCCSIHL